MAILTFKPKIITKQLISGLKDRTRDIVVQRFGLDESARGKTLEAIGNQYGVTRERVRQITNFAINSIKENPSFDLSSDAFIELKDIIHKKGKIISEKDILSHLAADPATENHIYFLLVLGDDFIKMKEDDDFHHRWTIDSEMADKVHEALRKLHGNIREEDLIPEKDIIASMKKYGEEIAKETISDDIARSWLNISKIITSNALGEWGYFYSPNIRPRGVRDLAFLVFRKEGSPMHFLEVAKKIASYFARDAHPATVHNELIKDDRFVLVGRGIYALKEWGYKFGTVRDVIMHIIKSEKNPVAKEDIIKRVLKERYVKENTILVNLQNRKYFKRNKGGRYLIT